MLLVMPGAKTPDSWDDGEMKPTAQSSSWQGSRLCHGALPTGGSSATKVESIS